MKQKIAELLENKGFQCNIELRCVDSDGRTRFIDILAIEAKTNKAFIIDPTVRYETNADIEHEVVAEKKEIYDKCHDFVKQQCGVTAVETVGLWFGARGAVPPSVIDFWQRFGLPSKDLCALAHLTQLKTSQMIRLHAISAKPKSAETKTQTKKRSTDTCANVKSAQ